MPPELKHHIHEILKHLKQQGPDDPAVSYIIRATIQKICHDKLNDFTSK